MGRPKRIILIRHGQSEANVDRNLYATIPDHRFSLTEKGRAQALAAGVELRKLIGDERAHAYVSPYHRTRETQAEIARAFAPDAVRSFEEPRIREQDWGSFRTPEEGTRVDAERDRYGTFFFRIPGGESGADVYDRTSGFIDTLFRDFERDDAAPNVLLVTHGLTMRLFLMRWFHWSVEKFEKLANPKNCQWFVMKLEPGGRYSAPELPDHAEKPPE